MSDDIRDRPATWRDDLDALQFGVPGQGSLCLVHRLAFRALLPAVQPSGSGESLSRQDCLEFFSSESQYFEAAAIAKIARLQLPPGRNLHLNSRDIRRAMAGDGSGGSAKACRVLGG